MLWLNWSIFAKKKWISKPSLLLFQEKDMIIVNLVRNIVLYHKEGCVSGCTVSRWLFDPNFTGDSIPADRDNECPYAPLFTTVLTVFKYYWNRWECLFDVRDAKERAKFDHFITFLYSVGRLTNFLDFKMIRPYAGWTEDFIYVALEL